MSTEIARSFRDLKVYTEARAAAKAIFKRSRAFPGEERFSMTDQIRRSSRSVKAGLAEAGGRRRYRASFVHKIDEAMGEAMETESWLDDALDCGYLNPEEHARFDAQWQAIRGRLARMIDRADDFCRFAPDTDYRKVAAVCSQTSH